MLQFSHRDRISSITYIHTQPVTLVEMIRINNNIKDN